MHIPDGFLSPPVWAGMDAVAAGSVALAVRKVHRSLDPQRVPVMGMAGAFIFAAQMVNFPVAGGTSGHLLGGFLAALLLGPAPAVVVMTTVFVVQCLIFQDGGITALGANIFNMGVVGAVGGYAVYRLLRRGRVPESAAIAAGAWLSVMAGAAATTLELALSGAVALAIAAPTILGLHALIGIGEALITVGAVRVVTRVRPELLRPQPGGEKA
ncbi:MAG TPA: energy-coupling factor ABC transporter permease [Armatimonadota bacterium]|nr:energy-coupling factor ABC transporter permease [Armatimonadota bacterium]